MNLLDQKKQKHTHCLGNIKVEEVFCHSVYIQQLPSFPGQKKEQHLGSPTPREELQMTTNFKNTQNTSKNLKIN